MIKQEQTIKLPRTDLVNSGEVFYSFPKVRSALKTIPPMLSNVSTLHHSSWMEKDSKSISQISSLSSFFYKCFDKIEHELFFDF